MYHRYRGARRPEKQRILDEFCQVTGQHRKHAIRLLNSPAPGAAHPPRPRAAQYPPAVIDALRKIWEAAGYPWSVRLKGAVAPVAALGPAPAAPAGGGGGAVAAHQPAPDRSPLGPAPPRDPHAAVRAHQAGQSAQTPHPAQDRSLGRGHPRLHGDRPRRPLRQPGRRGVRALPQRDGHPHHLVETAAVLGKSQVVVQSALEELRQALPFPLRGIDSDNGSEFINQHLWDYCQAQEIPFTRGRPYLKNDNAHIEQKNWTHVRKLLGYVRYDSPAARTAIHALYRHELRLFQNFFLPSVKLVRKERVGSRVRRRYDAPRTPLERVLACPELSPAVATQLRQQQARLDPFALAQAIDAKLERIYRLANSRHSPLPSATDTPPPPTPRRIRRRLSIKPSAQGTSWRPAPSGTSQVAR